METVVGSSLERLEVVNGRGKASKKLIREAGDIDFLSSARDVMSNDDLLIEILLRLPVFSLLLFKSVSKRWLSLIKATDFILLRTRKLNMDPSSGLYLLRHSYTVEYDFIPFDTRVPPNRSPFPTSFTFRVDVGNLEILQSCNGIFLCFIGQPDKFYVYNPSINHIKMIPHCHYSGLNSSASGLRLAFDPTKSPYYKLVYVDNINKILTYSSETCSWSVSGDRFSRECFRGFRRGVYWNDAIHWLEHGNGTLHYKLDVDHLVLTTIRISQTLDGMFHDDYMLVESCGCLLLVCKDSVNSGQLNIFEMKNGYSGWSMKYIVNLDDIVMLIPETWKMSPERFSFNVLSVVVGEKEEDLFLVMETYKKVVKYKVVLKTLIMLYDLGSIYPPVDKPSSSHSFPFIASFVGV